MIWDPCLFNPQSKVFKYGTHVLAAVLLLMLVVYLPQTRGSSWLYWLVFLLALAMFLQLGFPGVIAEAQQCAKPAEPQNLPWKDNSTVWYRGPFFALLVLAGLFYGLCLFLEGSGNVADKLLCFDPTGILPQQKPLKILLRVVSFLPLIGFLYYLYFIVVQKGELVKPLRSRLHKFERPLAIYFSAVFIPFLLYGIFGSKLWEARFGEQGKWGESCLYLLRKCISFRLLPLVMLFAVGYVFVWRLQGGLFSKKEDYDKIMQIWRAHQKKRL